MQVTLLVAAYETNQFEVRHIFKGILFIPQTLHANFVNFILGDLSDYNFFEVFYFYRLILLIEPIPEENTALIFYLLHALEDHYLFVVLVDNEMQDSLVSLDLLVL